MTVTLSPRRTSSEQPAAPRPRHRALAALTSPLMLSRIVFAIGAMTVASALSPAIGARVALLTQFLPGAFPAAATTGAMATGTLMMVMSRAIRRGKYRAWLLSVLLAGASVGLDIVKGLDVEEALAAAALLVLLLIGRRRFTARPDPRSTRRVMAVAVFGPLVATLLGTIWLAVDVDGEARGTTWADRVVTAFLGLVGIPGPVTFVEPRTETIAYVGLVVLGAAVFLALLLALVRPADGPHALSADDERTVRALLAAYGDQDSLSYFATRSDRSIKMSPNGQAAVSYRVIGTVSLAADDPLGNLDSWPGAINAWLAECDAYGWTPAVLGASEEAAEVYRRCGLDALELGDEAIIDTTTFSLEGREMRGVRQAVNRCGRAGLTTRCVRVGDLTAQERATIAELADAWRDGATERGFSMALGRFVSERDPEAVVVLASDADGRLHGVLSFVPWGRDGLSLDLMRRDRDSANGIIELMVAAVCAAAPDLGVRRISLNFAVFRAVFARGERIGAGPVLRLWCGALRLVSRFWQLESLYRSNAKYRPTWVPRFICFRNATDLPRIGTAGLRAEAFLTAPQWWRRARRR